MKLPLFEEKNLKISPILRSEKVTKNMMNPFMFSFICKTIVKSRAVNFHRDDEKKHRLFQATKSLCLNVFFET